MMGDREPGSGQAVRREVRSAAPEPPYSSGSGILETEAAQEAGKAQEAAEQRKNYLPAAETTPVCTTRSPETTCRW